MMKEFIIEIDVGVESCALIRLEIFDLVLRLIVVEVFKLRAFFIGELPVFLSILELFLGGEPDFLPRGDMPCFFVGLILPPPCKGEASSF